VEKNLGVGELGTIYGLLAFGIAFFIMENVWFLASSGHHLTQPNISFFRWSQ